MPAVLTDVTELATALGMLVPTLERGVRRRPPALRHVPDDAWDRLRATWEAGEHHDSFQTAFDNGRAFLAAEDGLRGRTPRLVEWRGPHRPPGDDVIPADLRIDHVFLVSCKYLSKVLLNPSPTRLFERGLVGEERGGANWFAHVAPDELQAFYDAAATWSGIEALPTHVTDLSRDQQRALKAQLAARTLPAPLTDPWAALCAQVAEESARRWRATLATPRDRLRLLWRMLRISTATYFVLGTARDTHVRARIDSNWDWMQAHELRDLEVAPRPAGQPEVGWTACVRSRVDGTEHTVAGHVEVRWSHGRFVGAPEAKVYLDTPYADVPGYHPLAGPDGQLSLLGV